MTEDIKFSGKLAKKIDLDELKKQEKIKDSSKLNELIDIFDDDSSNDIDIGELSIHINGIDKNKDGKITEKEIEDYFDEQNYSNKGVTKEDFNNLVQAVASQNDELVKTAKNVGNGYTIQLGEQLDDLVERVLKTQGIKEGDSDYNEKFENCKKAILENNPKAFATDKDGNYKWLIAGAKIHLPTNTSSEYSADKQVEDKDNYDDVVKQYKAWQKNKVALTYSVDTEGNSKLVNKDGEEVTLDTSSIDTDEADSENEVKPEDIIDFSKMTQEYLNEHESYKNLNIDDIKATAKKGIEIITSLTDDKVESCEASYDQNSNYYLYEITLKNGEIISVYCTDSGSISSIDVKDKIYIEWDGMLDVYVNDTKTVRFDKNYAMSEKDVDKLEKFVSNLTDFKNQNDYFTTNIANIKNPKNKLEGEQIVKNLPTVISNYDGELDKLTKENVYWAINYYNKSRRSLITSGIISQITLSAKGKQVTKVINTLLECAEGCGLSGTEEYTQVKDLVDKYYSKPEQETSCINSAYANACDKAINALMIQISNAAYLIDET